MAYNPKKPKRGKAERRVKMKANFGEGKLHRQIEKKWQSFWEKEKVFQIDLKKAKRPYYNLMMFPYPSAEGLHVGNVYAFTGSDIHGRFKKMQGYDVFEPMGFDAFGIHSENFAIKKGIHPKILVKKNVNNFRRQLKSLGCLFDWKREVDTTRPDYYKWTQWLFLQLFKAGLAYRKSAAVDWCPSCRTVLADEQVINGKCERCDANVVQKELEQWFFKITKYVERLLKNLDKIDWSEKTKTAQRNWIGKSEGSIIDFEIKNLKPSSVVAERGERRRQSLLRTLKISVFTTRADTLFGATYLVLAPEHPLIKNLKFKIKNWPGAEKYIESSKKKTELERTDLIKEKTGIEIKGIKAINPADQKEIPIFIADYVLMHYGTGAIMGVPSHDERDFAFAKKYNLPIKKVIQPPPITGKPVPGSAVPEAKIESECWIGEGLLINSGRFNSMESEKAKWEITKFVKGRKSVNYHLRDWLISRQRYWGPPIPVVFCQNCKKEVERLKSKAQNSEIKNKFSKGEIESPGWIAVKESDLPVLLPYVKEFRPTGAGSPLAAVKNFVNVKCPKCKGPAKRETDVSDTFLDSSWYFLRYPSVCFSFSDQVPFDAKITEKWLPVNMYIGGQEHAVLHLLYTRFITMALNDLGLIDFEEPFEKFRAHGLLTKEGAKMSKSKGNVVNPDEYYKKYGADTLRMYLMFLGPFSEGGDWQDRGIVGIKRFLEKIWAISLKIGEQNKKPANKNPELEKLLHQTIKKVTEDLENLSYNTAISALMILVNKISKEPELSKLAETSSHLAPHPPSASSAIEIVIKLLAPFSPYMTEELWCKLGNKESVHQQAWPEYKEKLIKEDKITLVVQINGRVRDKITVKADISKEEARKLALSREKVKKWTGRKKIEKVIFVPEKLINIVID